jgi:hypothetical protein
MLTRKRSKGKNQKGKKQMVIDRQRKRGLEVIRLKLPCLQPQIERKKLNHLKSMGRRDWWLYLSSIMGYNLWINHNSGILYSSPHTLVATPSQF